MPVLLAGQADEDGLGEVAVGGRVGAEHRLRAEVLVGPGDPDGAVVLFGAVGGGPVVAAVDDVDDGAVVGADEVARLQFADLAAGGGPLCAPRSPSPWPMCRAGSIRARISKA